MAKKKKDDDWHILIQVVFIVVMVGWFAFQFGYDKAEQELPYKWYDIGQENILEDCYKTHSYGCDETRESNVSFCVYPLGHGCFVRRVEDTKWEAMSTRLDYLKSIDGLMNMPDFHLAERISYSGYDDIRIKKVELNPKDYIDTDKYMYYFNVSNSLKTNFKFEQHLKNGTIITTYAKDLK